MIKKILLSSMLWLNLAIAASNPLFYVSTTGNSVTVKTTIPYKVYHFVGAKSLSQGFSVSNCAPDKNGYCIFQASDTTPASLTIAGPAVQPTFKFCLNGLGDTYSCESTKIAERFAYVTNFFSGSILLCAIKPDGTFDSCNEAGNTNQPYQIAINNAGSSAYLTKPYNDAVLLCPILPNGIFGSCVDSGNTGTPFSSPSGIALNTLGTKAYIANQGGDVSICPINSDKTFGDCVASGNTGVYIQNANGIVLNNSQTIAYVADSVNNSVVKCPINANGTFGLCTDSGNTGLPFNNPTGVVLNNNGTIAYVSNNIPNTVLRCPIHPNGSFGSCIDSGVGAIFSGPFGITLNTSGTRAYIANSQSNTVFECDINSNGNFTSCISTFSSLPSYPLFITLF